MIRQKQFCSLLNFDHSFLAAFCLKPLVYDSVGDKRQSEEFDREEKMNFLVDLSKTFIIGPSVGVKRKLSTADFLIH